MWGFLLLFCLVLFFVALLDLSVLGRRAISPEPTFIIFMIKVSCWDQLHNLSESLNFMVQECFLWVLYPPYCSGILNGVGCFVGRLIPSGWVAIRVTYKLCVWDAVQLLPPDEPLFPAESGA